jgi:RimJ/RimL family protein N-acetyltransferase
MASLPGVASYRLNPRHRDDIARHLILLPEDDRRLRFGQYILDEAVRAYVGRIDFARDRVFGVHAPDLALVGVAHLALDPVEQLAELGLSVDPSCRGKGYGFALLQRAVLHAANLGYRVLFMVCLAENRIMMHLARKAGLTLVVESGETDARLTLDRRTHGGALKEAMADQFALVDVMLKQQYLWLARPKPAPTAAIDTRGSAYLST